MLGLIHGWTEFFKVDGEKVFGLDTNGKAKWYPTLLCPKRLSTLKPITVDEAKLMIVADQELVIGSDDESLAFVTRTLNNKKINK